ncbi:MAG TPA: AAA family ATPase [Nostocaceae cyanobacterium]|nr:AAA family ATPase [Nostocaceae cyanobacterium]
MQRISIENFGPISKFTAEVKDVMLLIGPQAIGKSTISKLIFLFKSIKDEIMSSLDSDPPIETFAQPLETILNHIKINLLKTMVMGLTDDSFRIEFEYSPDKKISIFNSSDYLDIKLSDILFDELNSLILEIISYKIIYANQQKTNQTLESKIELRIQKQSDFIRFKHRLNQIFEDMRPTVFIPSGRSLMSTLSQQLQKIEKTQNMDFFTKSFVERITLLKPFFINDIYSQYVQEKFWSSLPQVTGEFRQSDFNDVKKASDIIKKILKGVYRLQDNEERIYINDNKFVRLQDASSGQQESVWILLLIFKYILDQTSIFVVFEEPEAHLYPETQSDIVDLIGLLANVNNNQIIITTHSPYILSSLNNLLYAYQVGTKKQDSERETVEKIVNQKSWLDPRRTAAYFIGENYYESIIDEELQLIKAEKIDSASGIINDKFNRLFDLDD